MHNKTVFVLLDGLQSEYAKEHLGYLEHLCEKQRAAENFLVLPALCMKQSLPAWKHMNTVL